MRGKRADDLLGNLPHVRKRVHTLIPHLLQAARVIVHDAERLGTCEPRLHQIAEISKSIDGWSERLPPKVLRWISRLLDINVSITAICLQMTLHRITLQSRNQMVIGPFIFAWRSRQARTWSYR